MALDLRTYGRRNNHDRGFDGVVREGNRGGQGLFKWTDVASDKHRENYLGHSVNAPVGRWQKNKDITWYTKEGADKDAQAAEIAAIKSREEEALNMVLGYKPAKTELTEEEQAAKLAEKAEQKALKRILKDEKRAQKEAKRAERAARRNDRAGSRSRSRSPRRSYSPEPARDARNRSVERHRGRGDDRRPRSRSRSPYRRDSDRRREDRRY